VHSKCTWEPLSEPANKRSRVNRLPAIEDGPGSCTAGRIGRTCEPAAGCAAEVRIKLALLPRILLLVFVTLVLVAAGGVATAAPSWQPPLRPLAVTRAFQPPPTPYAAGHRGVDLAGTAGQEVFAAAAGDVSYAGMLAGRGVVVVIHGSLRTTYEPVEASVRRGAHVIGGQPIGVLAAGHAGCPVAACLHWGLLRGDVYLDPLGMLTKQSIRLLPLGVSNPSAATATAATASAASPSTTARTTVATAAEIPGGSGPSPATWSLVAVSGAGVVVAAARRR
jgi:murein DD-endopeptidase MepM/ murein hydrolase activator NlpD